MKYAGRICQSGMGLFYAFCASAATWFVAPGGSDGNDGTSGWDQAFATISNAVVSSLNGDAVLVTNGHYYLSVALNINKSVAIKSVNGPEVTIIDGGNAVQCVSFANQAAGASTNAMLDGFTVTGGNAANGAAIRVEREGAWIHNCIITSNAGAPSVRLGNTFAFIGAELSVLMTDTHIGDNSARALDIARSNVTIRACGISGNGGVGVYISGLYPGRLVDDCRIFNNTNAGYAGGIYQGGPALITNCLIAGNQSTRGGGIYNNAGSRTGEYFNCTIISNTSSGEGGGAYLADDTIFVNCRFAANNSVNAGGGVYLNNTVAETVTFVNCHILNSFSANHGGGMYNDADTTLYNCLLAGNCVGNNTDRRGGGLHVGAGVLVQAWNSTIASNAAPDAGGLGGGVWVNGTGTLNLNNSILYDNHAGTTSTNWYITPGGVLAITNSCAAPTNGLTAITAGIDGDPRFMAPAAGDFRLQNGSPCIHTGLNQPWMISAVDLDGYPRIDRMVGRVDMGCYEYLHQGAFFCFY